LYRAALAHPAAIGVIDGYFEVVPTVWHKEILWAMAQGIHVFGAASIGALRAAELDSFGMRGVGRLRGLPHGAFSRTTRKWRSCTVLRSSAPAAHRGDGRYPRHSMKRRRELVLVIWPPSPRR
jgi:hypothetical protein